MLVLGSTVVESIESTRFSVLLLLSFLLCSVMNSRLAQTTQSRILFSHFFLSNYLFIHSGVLNEKGNFNCVLNAVMYTSVARVENHKATSTRRCFPTSVSGKLLPSEINIYKKRNSSAIGTWTNNHKSRLPLPHFQLCAAYRSNTRNTTNERTNGEKNRKYVGRVRLLITFLSVNRHFPPH